MALKEYRKKRSFTKTPEPEGGTPDEQQLHFVIQKHDASRLHYDFRLELGGVLKSWAVPKGPSANPDDKRLAVMVEDHPYDYRNFEGVIPKGQYGGGTVIVWDQGTYESFKTPGGSKAEMEKTLRTELRRGLVEVVLHGQKLKGKYALVKSNYQGENSWLLMKMKDKYARKTDILKKDKSVRSGKTIAQMEKNPDRTYGASADEDAATIKTNKKRATAIKKKKAATKRSSRKSPASSSAANSAKKTSAKKAATKSSSKASAATKKSAKKKAKPVAEPNIPQKEFIPDTKVSVAELIKKKGQKSAFPATLKPMLATLTNKPFDEPGWVYEVKWDGYRTVAHLNKGKVELKSRNNKSFSEKFYPIKDALGKLSLNAVLDGEIIVSNDQGVSDFGRLQNWRSEADGELIFYVFDILWVNGYSLLELTLEERRYILTELLPEDPVIRISQEFRSSGTEFYAAAKRMDLEGIMAKKTASTYSSGNRSKEWLKIKINKREEAVIGGYTRNEGTTRGFSSLLVGQYHNGKLRYTGKIGTGFSHKQQLEMLKTFAPLVRKSSPFDEEPDVNKPSRFRSNPPKATATWLKPELVCEVSFTEMTSDGVMRHPSFEGMREDKSAREVEPEKTIPVDDLLDRTDLHEAGIIKKRGKTERKTLLNPKDEQQERTLNGHRLKFSNVGKIYWPKEKITKRDMLNYYYQAAPFIVPYLKDRPQSLNRHPGGITGKGFYQKNVTGKVPSWIELFPYVSEGEQKNYMVCTNEAGLLYMSSLGCIEMNPWSSRVQSPDNPDFCIIDLDPDKNDFDQVVETARVTKSILDAASIPGYVKTSGSTGMHIYIPLGAAYDYEVSKEFGRLIATLVNNELPEFTSIERATAKRRGKIYIDFLQNRPQATVAAAYSLRPKPGATVSMPLPWSSVKKGLKIADFNIRNAIGIMREQGDIFAPVLGKGIDISQAIKNLEAL